ncbi:MAG TPA: cytochrome c3 family protein [Kofleriaceae bacterium]|nr:cytochrome c3 family protein [Kofleriaceae bacterium]
MRHLLVLIALAACRDTRVEPAAQAAPPAHPPRGTIVADSTIAARDYIGPEACGECHPEQHAQWQRSLHATMNQRASATSVLGRFDGSTVAFGDGRARFERAGGAYTMTLERGTQTVRYRVTRTIGTRGLQEYVGLEDGQSTEVRLPFGWWPRAGGWMPQSAFDPWLTDAFDPFAPVREPWAERCPWCHSTYPFEQRIARAAGRTIGHGFEQFFDGTPGSDVLAVDRQVTVGISCESCHLGGRAHGDGAPIHFVPIGAAGKPDAPRATTFAAERRDPAIVNTVCAQCHSGPSPRFADGSATRNSSEALDLAASPCTTARCTDCHDPHRADAHAADTEPRAIAACTRCHSQFADAAAARTHAGASHATASCLDCHMPRVVLGIDRFVRTHRISSPTDPRMLAVAAPNACNLCHLDRSIRWTTDELRAGYEVRLDPRPWAKAYGGDLDESVGIAWLASPQAAIRLVAAFAYARSSLARYVQPELARLRDDPAPYVRAWVRSLPPGTYTMPGR